MEKDDRGARRNIRQKKDLHLFIYLALAASIYLAYLTLKSLLHPIIFAAVLASFCVPMLRFYEKKLVNRPNLAALLVVLTVTLAIMVPLILLLWAMVLEGANSLDKVQKWLETGGIDSLTNSPRLAGLIATVREKLPFTSEIDLREQLIALSQKGGVILLEKGKNIAANLVSVTIDFFMMLFVMFYFLRDGKDIVDSLKALTPLDDSQDDRIILKIKEMSRSVFVGTFLTAIAQGVAGGIGLSISGISGLFWGAVMAIASLIPVVGTALIWVPAVGYLFITGDTGYGIFLLVWCVVVVGSIDNFLRPYLMKGEEGLSPFFVFLAVMGGIDYFGLAGVLYGPLVLSLVAAILQIYTEEFSASQS